MDEGGYSPEGADQFRFEREPVIQDSDSGELLTPVEPLTKEEMQEAQRVFAVGQGYENWEAVSPLYRAEFWAVEGDYEEVAQETTKAGLDRKAQLRLMVKATDSKLAGLRYDYRATAEFYRVDQVREGFRRELAELESK